LGNKVKKNIINIVCSILIGITFTILSNGLFIKNTNDLVWIGSIIFVCVISFLILNLKSNFTLTKKLTFALIFSFIFLLLFIFYDSRINEYGIINKILHFKGKSNYVGETRNSAITTIIFNNIYPVILVLSILFFIQYKSKKNIL